MNEKIAETRKEVVKMILENMKKGYIFQESEWNSMALRPQNPSSNVYYKGANRLRLTAHAFARKLDDPRWLTFIQIKNEGYHLKKGSHGVVCEKWIYEKEQKNEKGEIEIVALERPIGKTFVVFNAKDIEGIEPYVVTQFSDEKMLQIADDFIESSECPIVEIAQEQAYYSPMRDMIVLPSRSAFKDEVSFLKTALHEMGHSTGHPTRLNREMSGGFGSESYAREELRAELGALFTEAELGIHLKGEHINSHSNYLLSWIGALEKDPNELFKACSDADKIATRLIENYQKTKMQKMEIEENILEAKKIM